MESKLKSLDEFLRIACDLGKGLDKLLEDGQAALPSIILPNEGNGNFADNVKKEFEASSQRFKDIIADIGFYIPPEILAWTDPDAEVPQKLEKRLDTLNASLSTANSDLDSILKKANWSYNQHTAAAVRDLRAGIQSLTPIAEAIGGDFDHHMLDPSNRAAASRNMEHLTSRSLDVFKVAASSAEETVTDAMHTDAEIVNLRDATVLGKPHGIKDETEALQADLNSWIQSTNNKVNALQKTQDGFKDSLKIQNETLRIAQRKYEDAVSDADRAKTGEIAAWILCWPVGLALHLSVSKNLVEDVSNAKRIVVESEQHVKQSERDIKVVQLRLLTLQAIRSRAGSLSANVQSLLHALLESVDAAAVRHNAAIAVHAKVLGIWDQTQQVQDSAARTNSALSKARYAEAILLALSEASFEKSILVREPARFILWRLRDRDNDLGTVAGIRSEILYGGEPLLKKLLEIYETDPDTGVRCVVQ